MATKSRKMLELALQKDNAQKSPTTEKNDDQNEMDDDELLAACEAFIQNQNTDEINMSIENPDFEFHCDNSNLASKNEIVPERVAVHAQNDIIDNNSVHMDTASSSPDDSNYDPNSDDSESSSTSYIDSDPEEESINEPNDDAEGSSLSHTNKLLAESLHEAVTKAYRTSSGERVIGKSYIGFQRSSKDDNKVHRVGRNKRTMSPTRCAHKALRMKSDRTFLCATLSEDERQKNFSRFWAIPTWDEKKGFIRGLMSTRKIKQRRRSTKTTEAKKNEGHDLFLRNCNGDKVRVCRQFFLKTLNLGQDMFRTWVRDNAVRIELSSSESDVDEPPTPPSTPAAVTPITSPTTRIVEEWLDLLPKVPSHYCRASNKKSFVENTFTSFRHMHRLFLEWCVENEKKAVGRKKFNKVLDSHNIGIHKPRKDQCDTCFGYKIGNISAEEYNNHREKKSQARAKKKLFETRYVKGKTLVVSMDLQSVLLSPKLLASSVYYKQKLQLHNFTIYEKNSGHVELYVWHECDGGVSANEFVSCLADYITQRQMQYNTIILISDGCNNQNRNKVLSSTLSSLAVKFNLTIRQLILEKGHTMMPCDSVHSAVEHFFSPLIYSPSDYIARMRLARPDQPYQINVIDHTFFKNYESVSNVSSIRPGKKVGDPTVCDIRQLRYKPSGAIEYDLFYDDEFKEIPIRRSGAASIENVPQLRKAPVPLEAG